MRNVRRVSWLTGVAVLVAGGAVAIAAVPSQIQIVTDQGVCNATLQVTGCTGGSTPAPGATPTPTVVNPVPTVTPGGSGGGCPDGALDLNHPFERQATLLGYDRLRVNGSAKFAFCATTTKASSRGGNIGAAWQDSGGACTQLRIRLVSYNGNAVANGVTGWSQTPQLTYKLLFPLFQAPAGNYVFEIEANSSNCANGQGSFQVLWTP